MRSRRAWLLPALLVLNSAMSVALAQRASTLRRQAQVWELRATAWYQLGLTNRGGRMQGERAQRNRPATDVPAGAGTEEP